MTNEFNVNYVKIKDDIVVKILEEKYLNVMFKYDKLEVNDDILTFNIDVVDSSNISEEVLDGDEFSNYCSDLLAHLLKKSMELEEGNLKDNNDSRESDSKESD